MGLNKFALIGAAGYIAPKHMQAIKDTGNELVAAVDPHDNVGVIDSYFPDARFFTEIERFDRHLEKIRRSHNGIDYISVCTPNYLHDAHVRLALRLHASAICEKPLVINPWNLDQLEEIEAESVGRIYTVLQLRLLPSLVALHAQFQVQPPKERAEVSLTYVTRRGAWYDASWKGDQSRSGGVAMNIGVHFFDLVQWLFGDRHESRVFLRQNRRMAGTLELEHARIRWFLSIDEADLPAAVRESGGYAYRSMTLNGEEIEFSGFTDLHTRVYEQILEGRGPTISTARPAIDTIFDVRHAGLSDKDDTAHHFLWS